jgi:hypothetical protein
VSRGPYFKGWNHRNVLATFRASGYHVESAYHRSTFVAKGGHVVCIPRATKAERDSVWTQPSWVRFRDKNNIRVVTLRGTCTFSRRA